MMRPHDKIVGPFRKIVVGRSRRTQQNETAAESPSHRASSRPGGSSTPRPMTDQPAASAAALTSAHSHRSDHRAVSLNERKRLYLRVGDEVNHLRYDEWGIGVVMEVMTSSVPGGTCLVRIRFQDGQLRCFNNDLDNESCCYYFGVRRYWNPSYGLNAVRSKFFIRG